MRKTIFQMVKDKKASMLKNKSEAGANMTLAVAAINGGIRSPEWRAYMMQFVEQRPPGTPDDPAQQDRLLGTDGTLGHQDLNRARAYLVSNGTCSFPTTDRFDLTVGSVDLGLDPCEFAVAQSSSSTNKVNRKRPSGGVLQDVRRRSAKKRPK
jgi:hypothetical protein